MIDAEEKPIESVEETIETLVPGLSQAEYEKIRSEALEKAKAAKHNWHMKGRGVICCTACPFPHRTYIDPNKTLVGISPDGLPILQDYVNIKS